MSILNDVKKALGIPEEHKAFDPDVTMFINGAFSTLRQLGVGPALGFAISGEEEDWAAFTGPNVDTNMVKTYLPLKVRLDFDPPQMSHHVNALKERIQELEYRLNTDREEVLWKDSRPLKMLPVDLD